MRFQKLKHGILTGLLFLSSGSFASQVLSFSSYLELQKNLLTLVESSKERVWYASRWLSDTVLAEQLAQAVRRKVDVRMLLGSWTEDGTEGPKILMFLSDQAVPFFLSPTLRKESITAVLIDQRLIWVNAILGDSNMAPTLFLKSAENPDKTQNYIAFFRKHFKPELADQEWHAVPDIYSYEKNKGKATPHIIKKLPKTVKWSEKAQ